MISQLLESMTAPLLALLASAVIAVFKSFRFVQEGRLGIKLRFGKAVKDRDGKPRVIRPGLFIMVPFIDSLHTRHVRQQTIRLTTQEIVLKDGLIFKITGVVIFKVVDIYKALFEVDDLDGSIEDYCISVLRDRVASAGYAELTGDELSKSLLQSIGDKAGQWGVEFISFGLAESAPTPETAHLLNAEIGVELKSRALAGWAKSRGTELSQIPAQLAAVLVGVPLIVSVSGREDVGGTTADKVSGPDIKITGRVTI